MKSIFVKDNILKLPSKILAKCHKTAFDERQSDLKIDEINLMGTINAYKTDFPSEKTIITDTDMQFYQ